MIVEAIEKIEIQKKDKIYTIEEYFQLEEASDVKHEFINGKLDPMAGGTISHNTIIFNLLGLFFIALMNTEKQLRAFPSDQKIYIPNWHQSLYADASVVEGKIEKYKGGKQAITNPILIVEVSSKSTVGYDKGLKFGKYKNIPSFEEYVLVNQDMPYVDILNKTEGGWLHNTYMGIDAELPLKSLGITLKMSDLYKNVEDLLDPQIAMDFNPQEK